MRSRSSTDRACNGRSALLAGALLVLIGPVAQLAAQSAPAAVEEEPEIIGATSGFGEALLQEEMIEVAAGTALYRLPDLRSSALGRVDFPSVLPVLERRTGWALVRYGARTGWLRIHGETPDEELGALDLRPPDPQRLLRALEILGPEHLASRIGPFEFYTNIRDSRQIERLQQVGNRVLETYIERYGVDPGTEFNEIVVIFANEAEYRAYEDPESALDDLEAGGHTGFGIATLYSGDHADDEVAALLIHELTHLLNRRAFGTRLSAWLEEGLCEDLAFSRITKSGKLETRKLSGSREEREWTERDDEGTERTYMSVRITGAVASLKSFLDAVAVTGTAQLDVLTDLSWGEFVEPEERHLNYSASGLLVRYLLDGNDGALAAPFREFLRDIAAEGRTADGSALLSSLGVEWPELEVDYLAWVGDEGRSMGVSAGPIGMPPEEPRGKKRKDRKRRSGP